MHVLVVKTSSLGDVVHTLPALGDAAAALPGLRFDWLVERAFAEIPAWHPAVDSVIECDLRSWRRGFPRSLGGADWRVFTQQLRRRRYALVIDAQGLLKSALLARLARGPLVGPDRAGAREPLAAAFYTHRVPVPRHDAAHAVDRLRTLFAGALDYTRPDAPADAGIDHKRFPRPDAPRPYVVFLHGTTWPGKRWPMANWRALGAWLAARGLDVVLPWGNAMEQEDAEAIAAACAGRVLPRASLGTLAGWLAHARLCVGVDTGLAHLAAALGTPQLTLYGPTLPALTGAVGAHQVWLRSDDATTIDRVRTNTVTVERAQTALEALLDSPPG